MPTGTIYGRPPPRCDMHACHTFVVVVSLASLVGRVKAHPAGSQFRPGTATAEPDAADCALRKSSPEVGGLVPPALPCTHNAPAAVARRWRAPAAATRQGQAHCRRFHRPQRLPLRQRRNLRRYLLLFLQLTVSPNALHMVLLAPPLQPPHHRCQRRQQVKVLTRVAFAGFWKTCTDL